MTTAVLSPSPLKGTAPFSFSLPVIGAYPRVNVQDDVVPSMILVSANPTVTPVTPAMGPQQVTTKSMLTDYYGRIHVIPELIDLRNPPLGQPQSYSLWNAFLEARTLDSVDATGDTGLVNSAVPPVDFRATELIGFDITVTAAADIVIDAQYTFTFDEGFGVLLFRAERATIFNLVPETPLVQTLNYVTDVMKAWDGTEQRVGVRAYPRQVLSGKIVAENDQEARSLRAQMFFGVVSPVVVPLWHETFSLYADAGLGTFTLSGDFAIADWAVDDFLYLETTDGDTFELVKLDTISDTTLTVTNALKASYPAGSKVYPTMTGTMRDNSSFSRYPVNASVVNFRVEAFERRALGGKTASVDTYNSLTMLDRRPLNNELIPESFSIRSDKIDYGGVYEVKTSQAFSNISRPVSLIIADRDDLQFWKLFLDTIVGRREPLYMPTFRADLLVVVQPDIGGSVIVISDDPNYLTDWWPSIGHRDIVINNVAGDRLYRSITGAVDNGDGTVSISLDVALPGTADESTIVSIEFLELVRLHSDQVILRHHGNYSTISFRIATTEE